MEPHAQDSTRLGLHDAEQSVTPPQLRQVLPLRIVKRSDSTCGDDADDRPCRKCSQATNESRGSATDSTGGEQQLTVPKVRGSRSSQVFDSLGDVDETPVPLGREAYLRNGYVAPDQQIIRTGQRMPSNQYYNVDTGDLQSAGSCSSRRLPKLRGKGLAKSAVGFRDQFCFLSPRNGVSPPYRPFPGLLGDIIQRSRTSHTLPSSDSDDPFSTRLSKEEPDTLPIVTPEVTVTADTRVVDHGYHNFWVAVEITATRGNGCLCDIKVDIEPTANSAVLEVIENFSAPTSLQAGSEILVLVNVELDLANHSRIRGHIRSHSDDLMEDLEDQLGSAQCEYLTVSLIYQHSAFAPSICASNGVTRAQTKMRTTYTAAGMDAADELLQTKLTKKPTPRKTTYLGGRPQNQHHHHSHHHHPSVPSRRGRGHGQGVPMMPTRPAPAPPPHHPAVDENERSIRGRRRDGQGDDDDDNTDADQASRIWARMRRCSGVSLADRTNMSMVEEQSLAAKRGIPKAGGKGRKGSGRWGFGNWWA
ncbi:hypothetical protein diail_10412 [Diaporthe ilicicola]|nr:hypothetical protein diail_10412 [Diaporthe ilicicola]